MLILIHGLKSSMLPPDIPGSLCVDRILPLGDTPALVHLVTATPDAGAGP